MAYNLTGFLKAVLAFSWAVVLCLRVADATPLVESPTAAQQGVSVVQDVAISDLSKAGLSMGTATDRDPHAGYPTTREKWRYCPRDGSHQCVDLDIPGVTVPDQPSTQ